MLTKEQFEALMPYEKHIINAYKNSFVHMLSGDFDKVAVIYREVYNTVLTKSQRNCNSCRLKVLKRIGEEYLAYKDALEQKETVVEEKPKSNKGRKKKLEE